MKTSAFLTLVPLAAVVGFSTVACSPGATDPGASYIVEGVVNSSLDGEGLDGILVTCSVSAGDQVVTGGGELSTDGGVVSGCGEEDNNCPAGHFKCLGGGLGPAGNWPVRVAVEDPTGGFQSRSDDFRARATATDPPPVTIHNFTLEPK